MPTYLPQSTYNWALSHLLFEGDTDLLPALPEVEAISFAWQAVGPKFAAVDLENYQWRGERRFVVPKEGLAFRSATQLDPVDSLMFAAIVREWGHQIEAIRVPPNLKRVYSHRFAPTALGRFYGDTSGWHAFWERSIELADGPGVTHVLMADVVDYYNQVYHHVLENQLDAAGLPKPAWRAIKRLMGHLTQGVSRGVPVGPHASHLLAEAAFNPIDRDMLARGMEYCRYVDDIHVFCTSEQGVTVAAQELAAILDVQQRLTLHKQKTQAMSKATFLETANAMLEDRPLDNIEDDIMAVIRRYSTVGPYDKIDYESVTEEDLKIVRAERLEPLLEKYLSAPDVDYGHVRWLLRRLSQLGAPGALEFIVKRLDEFAPALGDVARYVLRASPRFTGDWRAAGDDVVNALNHPLAQHSDYVKVVILHLFALVPELNHFEKLTARFMAASPAMRREIVFAARAARSGAWLRGLKVEFEAADPWTRRAIVASASEWPGDEGQFWLKAVKGHLTFAEKLMARWAFRDPALAVGELSI